MDARDFKIYPWWIRFFHGDIPKTIYIKYNEHIYYTRDIQ